MALQHTCYLGGRNHIAWGCTPHTAVSGDPTRSSLCDELTHSPFGGELNFLLLTAERRILRMVGIHINITVHVPHHTAIGTNKETMNNYYYCIKLMPITFGWRQITGLNMNRSLSYWKFRCMSKNSFSQVLNLLTFDKSISILTLVTAKLLSSLQMKTILYRSKRLILINKLEKINCVWVIILFKNCSIKNILK